MDVLKNTEVRDGKTDSKKTNERIGSIPKSDDGMPLKKGVNGMYCVQHTVVKLRL